MYLSVVEILKTDIDIIRKYILQSMGDIVGLNYNEYNIEQMNIDELMKLCGCKYLKKIDSLTISHITPRENIDSVYQEGLLTLPHVLTKKTILSEHLYKFGFEFKFENKQISMKRNGEMVNIEKLLFSNLRMRFGGENTFYDFNVNGYLFVDKFQIDAVRGWLGSPEFLKSLANAYGEKSIANNYAEKCENYYVSFEVPIEKVDVEGFPDYLDDDKKTEILLKYTINALAHSEYKGNSNLSMYNPIIMLKRNYDVLGIDIRKIWKLEYTSNMLVPV